MVFISCSVLLLLFIKRLLNVIQFEAFIFTDYLHIGEQPNPSPCFSTVFFFIYIIAPHCVRTNHSQFEQTVSMPFVQVLVRRVSELQFCIRFLFVIWIFVLSGWIVAAVSFVLLSEVKRLYRNPSYWNGVTLLT